MRDVEHKFCRPLQSENARILAPTKISFEIQGNNNST